MEETLIKLTIATGKQKQEIINFVQSNIISYEDVLKFYCKFNRFPNQQECFLIYHKILIL